MNRISAFWRGASLTLEASAPVPHVHAEPVGLDLGVHRNGTSAVLHCVDDGLPGGQDEGTRAVVEREISDAHDVHRATVRRLDICRGGLERAAQRGYRVGHRRVEPLPQVAFLGSRQPLHHGRVG